MLEALLKKAATGAAEAVYLVHGDLVLAEPTARRLAEALAAAAGCEIEVRRQPSHLSPLLDDLRTYSLFSPAKVVLAVHTAVLADRGAAAELIDEAAVALPLTGGAELSPTARQGASRLLQALRLFELDAAASDPARLMQELPRWVLEGGTARRKRSRKRSKKEIDTLLEGLGELLAAARAAGITGWAEDGVAALGALLENGLPPGHSLVLAERSVAADHPLAAALAERGALIEVGEVASQRRGGFQGLEAVATELATETGVEIEPAALAELARRTLRLEREGPVEADSTARLAGEYRKLANLAQGEAAAGADARITRRQVEAAVEDRGQEDIWQLLDAVGAGRPGEALDRLRRLLASADDPLAARLSFFGLLASFCRQLTAIRGMMRVAEVHPGESRYHRFRDRLAPRLQASLPDGAASPLAGLHPYRLHRAYLAAGRFSDREAALLPWRVLRTELELKGESGDPDAALESFLVSLATAGADPRRAKR